MEITCLLNPGVFKYQGKIWLLLRVAERPIQKEGIISFPIYNEKGKIEVVSFLKNDPDLDASDPRVIGYKGKIIWLRCLTYDWFQVPTVFTSKMNRNFHLFSEKEAGSIRHWGLPCCNNRRWFYLTFTEVSSVAVGVGLIHTNDWKNYTRHGMIFPPHNKDCALFEQKIGDKYFALHRPSSPELGGNYIWLAESPDRLHWETTNVWQPLVTECGIAHV